MNHSSARDFFMDFTSLHATTFPHHRLSRAFSRHQIDYMESTSIKRALYSLSIHCYNSYMQNSVYTKMSFTSSVTLACLQSPRGNLRSPRWNLHSPRWNLQSPRWNFPTPSLELTNCSPNLSWNLNCHSKNRNYALKNYSLI